VSAPSYTVGQGVECTSAAAVQDGLPGEQAATPPSAWARGAAARTYAGRSPGKECSVLWQVSPPNTRQSAVPRPLAANVWRAIIIISSEGTRALSLRLRCVPRVAVVVHMHRRPASHQL
jgi:hypothetical protein